MADQSHETNMIISTGTIIRFFAIGALLMALYYISDVVLVIMAAIVIASAIEPIIRRMNRRKVHRIISVIVIYVIVAAILTAILIFFMPLIVNDALALLNELPQTVSLQDIWNPLSSISGNSVSSQAISQHTISIYDFVNSFKSFLAGTSAEVFRTASAVFGGVFSFLLILVLSFYLAVREDGVDDFLRIIAPVKHHEYIIDLWKRSQRKIALWLQGQIILGILIGVLVYLALAIVGIPHALMLAVFAGIFEIIPVFGPIFSSIPAIILAFSERGVGIGFLILGLYLVIYQFESQLFYPLVVKKIVGISPIVVILALVIGAKLAGILGALIAVPLSAAFMEYVNDIEKYKKAESAERAALERSGEE